VDLKQRIEYCVPWPFEIRKYLKDENKLQGRLLWPEFRKGMIVSSWLTARGLILKQKLTHHITGSCKQVNIDNMLPEGLFGGFVWRRGILGVGLGRRVLVMHCGIIIALRFIWRRLRILASRAKAPRAGMKLI